MITGNFALLAGLNPKKVHEWYLAVYADAFDWVEVPNTIGMALHADGGIMATKPYAASARYISKMSNFCKSCKFDPDEIIGENACPFNSLYWNFMKQNESKLKSNQRLKFVYPTWYKMKEEKREEILKTAKKYLEKLENNQL
jgi:deoxyribodipyrimidine photolyase-related protein